MTDSFEVRHAVSTDLPRLMGMDHSVASEYVWQVDLRKEPGQVSVNLREVRLPRAIRVEYPRNPYALADDWKRKSAMLVAMDGEAVGYACLYEQAAHIPLIMSWPERWRGGQRRGDVCSTLDVVRTIAEIGNARVRFTVFDGRIVYGKDR